MSVKVTIVDVMNLPHDVNFIIGEGDCPTFRGKIKCGDIVLDVMEVYAVPIGGIHKPNEVLLNCVSKNATKDMIGKTFYAITEYEENCCEEQPEAIAVSA